MAHKYYLSVCYPDGTGKALNIDDGNRIKNAFGDIAEIDLILYSKKSTEIGKMLNKTNKDTYLKGNYCIVSYPHSKGNKKVYIAGFNHSNDQNYFMDELMFFAKQRVDKKNNGKKIKLDEDERLEIYIREIIKEIFRTKAFDLTNFDTMVPSKIKELIKNRYKKNMSEDHYINMIMPVLRNILSNYTSLRNLVISMEKRKEGLNINLRPVVNLIEKYYEIDNLYPNNYSLFTDTIESDGQLEITGFESTNKKTLRLGREHY